MSWACPTCLGTHLDVVALVTVRLHDTGDNFETTDEGSDYEWDDESPMTCRDCGYSAPSKDFKSDYVICVGGTPGYGWLTLPSDEQSDADVIVTTDLEMVARYADYSEAKARLQVLVSAHPRREFSIRPLPRLSSTVAPDQLRMGFLPIGTRILSIQGEMSDTDDGQDVQTDAYAVGEILGVYPDQANCYSVTFSNGVCVLLSREELAGPDYVVLQTDVTDQPVPWSIAMCRIGYGHQTFVVMAHAREEALILADDVAGNVEYSEHTSEYQIQSCNPVRDLGAAR